MVMLELKPERLMAGEFETQPVAVCGKQFEADMWGGLYWPAERALIVADLHFEKGSSFARGGQMLPPYDTRDTLLRVARCIDRTGAEVVIALGDSLHDIGGAERMGEEDRETLGMLQEGRDWLWVTGNHDPEIGARLGGHVVGDVEIAGLAFRHVPTPGHATHEIAGHLHPAARLVMHGYSLRRPCFIGNGQRLVMPAFGSYCGGLNVLAPEFEPMFGADGFAVWMLGEEGLYPVATRLLRED